ncbi:hypothetical protein AB0K23_01615 [Streptomyces sp. NPDC049602]|uniref:hypothetical protein n=1 Tax=Streptomyces sp. NPDC049602 TaxID=3155504 RepID=UPI0034471BFD
MSAFPQLDPDGVVWRLNLWGDLTGGVPVTVGMPANSNLNEADFQEEVRAFAASLASRFDVTITSIVRHESTSSELQLGAPEVP